MVYGARNYSQESEPEEALSASSQRESTTVLPVTISPTDGLWSHGIRPKQQTAVHHGNIDLFTSYLESPRYVPDPRRPSFSCSRSDQ